MMVISSCANSVLNLRQQNLCYKRKTKECTLPLAMPEGKENDTELGAHAFNHWAMFQLRGCISSASNAIDWRKLRVDFIYFAWLMGKCKLAPSVGIATLYVNRPGTIVWAMASFGNLWRAILEKDTWTHWIDSVWCDISSKRRIGCASERDGIR